MPQSKKADPGPAGRRTEYYGQSNFKMGDREKSAGLFYHAGAVRHIGNHSK